MLKRTSLCSPTGNSQVGRLEISRNTFDEVINYAKAADKNEVCGFLLVRQYTPNDFEVIDGSLHIPRQLAAAGASEPLPQGESAQMDIEDEYEDDPEVFRVLWHSHMNGEARFSSTDIATHNRMATTTGHDAMFFMVVNARGQATANIEVYRPFRIGTQLWLSVIENEDELDLEPYKQKLAEVCEPYLPKLIIPTYRHGEEEPRDFDIEEHLGLGATAGPRWITATELELETK